MQLKLKDNQGDITRILNITILEIHGNLADVPIDKTYEGWPVHRQPKIVIAKLNIESEGFIMQRMHYLYRSSKEGYYCEVCKRKAYFSNEEIKQAKVCINE